ncbi:MAG: hypothetical protein ACLR7U_06495 [Ruthenibacterium lactatiformans]
MKCPWGGGHVCCCTPLLRRGAKRWRCRLRPQRRGPYGSFADNTFPDAAFAAIHTRPLPRNQKPVRGEYTQTTVLGDMLDSRTGRALHALALCAARLGMHFSNNPAVNRRVCEMTVRDLPFKNLVLNTSGIIRYPAAEALLALANGRLFSRGGTVRAERGRSRKG